MSTSVVLPWDEALIHYDFGPTHPLNPIRVDLTMRLARSLGLLDLDNVTVVPTEPADDDVLRLVHEADYIAAVRRLGADPTQSDPARGLGTEDDPVFAGMHDAAALVAGASVRAARAVWTGEAEHAVNIAGGLHHAMPGAASGFCVYNDPAIAIAWLLAQGAQRVAYVDVDVHHGDGVERIFWDDPRVLTISIHESGRYLFPGTGFPDDVGGAGAEGFAVNIALPPGTTDTPWLRAFDAVVPPLLAEFKPEVLVSQQGCDSHVLDPLPISGSPSTRSARPTPCCTGGPTSTPAASGWPSAAVAMSSSTSYRGPGATSSPRPRGRRSTPRPRRRRNGGSTSSRACAPCAPQRMTDGATPTWAAWSDGYDPADAFDRAVLATQRAVFPAHGLGGLLGP